ncbi:hypothetical protein MMC19_004237 [Ptychographa xylographoides]|nr:hypothetical protein [Ptychographa xylographoides]
MAAIPPQQASSRTEDSSTGDDFAHIEAPHSTPPKSEASEDSPKAIGRSSQGQALPPEDEPRKCWICFADETEDTPTTSAWRSPCPCALTAHESCLLDWVADLEAPTSRKRTGAPAKIQCPQCKKDIVIARPRSLVVDGVGAAERVAGKLVVPGILATLAGSLFTGCWIHGLSAIYLVFGREDFKYLMGVDSGEGISAKWGVGLPLIPVVLVLSRTQIADNILPVLPILFFATQAPDVHAMDLWPPSAAMTVATLPYVRGAYNAFYKYTFADKEQRWIKEIQPRAGENGEDNAGDNERGADGGNDDEGENLGFELNLEVEIFEEEEVPVGGPEDRPPQQGGQADAHQEPGQAPVPVPAARQNNILLSTSRIADTIVGALCFPAIASIMGQLIKVGLPKSWTVPSGARQRPGLLQTRWGRSIIGGCLFVVMKDTLLLYSRYRVAQDHRKRRVLDYDRSKGKGVGR